MVCPAPILELSKAARNYGKQTTVLEIIVDDAEFPNDLRAWCRASKNTLLNLMEDDGLFVAHVGLNIRGEEKGPASGPRTMATSQKAPPLLTTNGEVRTAVPASGSSTTDGEHPLHTIDCRGMQCPAPILAVAKKAQQLGRQAALMEILATDEQFPTDLKAWCRASKAQLVNVDRIGGEIRALVALGNVPQEVINNALPPPVEEVSMPLVNVKVAPVPATVGEVAHKPVGPELPKAHPVSPPSLRKIDLPALVPPVAAVSPPSPAGPTRALATPAPATPPVPVALRSSPNPEAPKSAPNVGALAAVAPANDVSPQPAPRENRCTLLVNKYDVESLLAALTYAASAAEHGMVASVYFAFAGVKLLRAETLRGGFTGTAQQFLLRNNLRNLEEWLAGAPLQSVNLVVCSMSLELMGTRKHDIVALPNVKFADVANFVEVSRRSAMTMVF